MTVRSPRGVRPELDQELEAELDDIDRQHLELSANGQTIC